MRTKQRTGPCAVRWLLLGTAAFVASTSARLAAAQLYVSPVIVEIPVDGVATYRTLTVTNAGAAPASVRFYVGDFDQEQSGEHRFSEPGMLPGSCARRIRVYPDGASLLPGETQSVRVDMEPDEVTCWSAVFVETAGMTAGGALVRQRVAAKVYGVPPTARREGEVIRVSLHESARTLGVTFRNTGDAPLRPDGELEIRSFTGERVATVPIEAFSVLPGHERTLELPLPRIERAGEYLAIPILDFGGPYLAGGQLAFQASSGGGRYTSLSAEVGRGEEP